MDLEFGSLFDVLDQAINPQEPVGGGKGTHAPRALAEGVSGEALFALDEIDEEVFGAADGRGQAHGSARGDGRSPPPIHAHPGGVDAQPGGDGGAFARLPHHAHPVCEGQSVGRGLRDESAGPAPSGRERDEKRLRGATAA